MLLLENWKLYLLCIFVSDFKLRVKKRERVTKKITVVKLNCFPIRSRLECIDSWCSSAEKNHPDDTQNEIRPNNFSGILLLGFIGPGLLFPLGFNLPPLVIPDALILCVFIDIFLKVIDFSHYVKKYTKRKFKLNKTYRRKFYFCYAKISKVSWFSIYSGIAVRKFKNSGMHQKIPKIMEIPIWLGYFFINLLSK